MRAWAIALVVALSVALPVCATQTEPIGPAPSRAALRGKPMKVDLGGGVAMEFVWVEPLKTWVGKYEVTNGEYRRFKPGHVSNDLQGRPLNSDFLNRFFPPGEANGNDGPGRTFDGDRQPVVCVDFSDAKEYTVWINRTHGAQMPVGYHVRLPSEAEFMTYAQCGDGRKYPWGNQCYPYGGNRAKLPKYGNYQGDECRKRGSFTSVTAYNDGYPITCPVERSGQNDWGLYGVGGNVWEACTSDLYGAAAFGAWRGSSWWGWCGKVENNLLCSWRINTDGTIASAVKDWCVPHFPKGSNPKSIDAYTVAAVNLGFRLVLSSQEADQAAEEARQASRQNKPTSAAKATPPGEPLTLDLGGGVAMEFVWIEALKMWVGKYELTNGEYRRFMPDYRDHRLPDGNLDYNLDRIPKTWVNWDDAKEYAAWLNWAYGDKMPSGYRVRLPAGKEWMTLAQCGDGRKYPWGNELPPKYGNYSGEEVGHGVVGGGAPGQSMVGYSDGYVYVCPVEKSGKNDWGLYRVGGNLAEACATDSANTAFEAWYGSSFYPHGAPQVDLDCYRGRVPNGGMNRVWMQGFRLVLAPESTTSKEK